MLSANPLAIIKSTVDVVSFCINPYCTIIISLGVTGVLKLTEIQSSAVYSLDIPYNQLKRSNKANSVAVSHDGELVLLSSPSGVDVWNIKNTELMHTLVGCITQGSLLPCVNTDTPTSCFFSPSGKYIAACFGSRVFVWDSLSGSQLFFIISPEFCVSIFFLNGDRCLVLNGKKSTYMYDTNFQVSKEPLFRGIDIKTALEMDEFVNMTNFHAKTLSLANTIKTYFTGPKPNFLFSSAVSFVSASTSDNFAMIAILCTDGHVYCIPNKVICFLMSERVFQLLAVETSAGLRTKFSKMLIEELSTIDVCICLQQIILCEKQNIVICECVHTTDKFLLPAFHPSMFWGAEQFLKRAVMSGQEFEVRRKVTDIIFFINNQLNVQRGNHSTHWRYSDVYFTTATISGGVHYVLEHFPEQIRRLLNSVPLVQLQNAHSPHRLNWSDKKIDGFITVASTHAEKIILDANVNPDMTCMHIQGYKFSSKRNFNEDTVIHHAVEHCIVPFKRLASCDFSNDGEQMSFMQDLVKAGPDCFNNMTTRAILHHKWQTYGGLALFCIIISILCNYILFNLVCHTFYVLIK